jgi:myosin heavy subunit
MTKLSFRAFSAACFAFCLLLTLTQCTNTKEEALKASREIILEQDKEIEAKKKRIDTLEQAIRAISQARDNAAAQADTLNDYQRQLKSKATELEQTIKEYQNLLAKKENEFKEYRNLALEEKKVAEIREEKKKLLADNEFMVNKIKQLKQMKEINEVMNGLADIIEKIPPFNKFDCYYRDKKDLLKNASQKEGYSPKLLLMEEGGTYPMQDIGEILVDLDLNFFKLKGNPTQANITLCLYEQGKEVPLYCQDEIFESERKRIVWKQSVEKTFQERSYYFQVRYGDQVLTEPYRFSVKK